MFYYRDYTFGEAGRIFCLTAISTGKVCCIVANLSEHTYIDRFTFIIPYRISLLIEKNFFESHRNSFHLHFCHCFFFICLNYYLNWNRREESNPYFNLISVTFYHWTTSVCWEDCRRLLPSLKELNSTSYLQDPIPS